MNLSFPQVRIDREAWPGAAEYVLVPIDFTVERVFDVGELRSGGFRLSERELSVRYVKDYDVFDGPESWGERFDLNRWVFFAARIGSERAGGAALALETPGITDAHGRLDAAVLWDLRVAPAVRRQGIGAMLLEAAEQEARRLGLPEVVIETQNVNVPACRLYQAEGYRLREVCRDAYPEFPEEARMLWHKELIAHD